MRSPDPGTTGGSPTPLERGDNEHLPYYTQETEGKVIIGPRAFDFVLAFV